MLAIRESMEKAEAFRLSVDEDGDEEEAIGEEAVKDLQGEEGLGREPPFINIAAATAVAAEG